METMASEANSPTEEWETIVEECEESDVDPEEFVADDLSDVDYTDLTNLSRSVREQYEDEDMDIPTASPGKDELVEALAGAGVFSGSANADSEFYRRTDDGVEAVELLESRSYDSSGSGSSGEASAKTVLYCFTRQATTEEDLVTIRDRLEDADYWIEASEGDGDKFMVRRDPIEDEVDSDAVDAIKSDSSDDEGQSSDSDEESESEASDSSDEQPEDDGDDDSDLIPYEVAEERLDEQNKPEVYAIAADEEIDGRSDMDKPELIEAVLEQRVGDKVAAPEE